MNYLKVKKDNLSRFYRNESRKISVKKKYPAKIWVEPTNICNLKCIMCFQDKRMTRPKGYMSIELFNKIIDEISVDSPTVNLFHSGEPLLHKEICTMIQLAHNAGCKTVIHTNATFLTEDLARKICSSQLDMISFSFEGDSQEMYESIRINGNFSTVLNNIETFIEIKKETQALTRVRLQIIEMKTTSELIRCFKDKYKKWGVEFYVQPLMDWAGDIDVDRANNLKKYAYNPCGAPWYNGVILWNGDVVPCCLDYNGKWVAGNVNHQRFIDIYNGEKMNELRTLLINRKNNDIDLCCGCENCYLSHKPSFKHFMMRKMVRLMDKF